VEIFFAEMVIFLVIFCWLRAWFPRYAGATQGFGRWLHCRDYVAADSAERL
jgi:hypothetical protein